MFPRGGGERSLPRHSRREATYAVVPGMGNSPTRIAIAYKSGWSRGISLLEYGGLNPILPFLGGRSDAACRVVIFLHDVSQRFLQRRGMPRRNRNHTSPCVAWYTAWRRWQWAAFGAMRIAMPPVGAGSSQREDSPARPPSAPIGAYRPGARQRPFIRHGLVREGARGGRATFGPPLQHRPYQDPHETRRCPHKRRGTPRRYKRPPRLPTLPPPAPYHRPTCAAAPSDFMPKSEGAAAQVGRWYGAGTAEYGGMGGGIQDCTVCAYGGGVR